MTYYAGYCSACGYSIKPTSFPDISRRGREGVCDYCPGRWVSVTLKSEDVPAWCAAHGIRYGTPDVSFRRIVKNKKRKECDDKQYELPWDGLLDNDHRT